MRIGSMRSIKAIAVYDDGFGLYSMDVSFDYDLDRVISRGITDDRSLIESIRKEVLPFIPLRIRAPEFACTAFMMRAGERILMGRNYDFKFDTSALLVRCRPRNGYASVAFAALDNIDANSPSTFRSRLACLTAPFICLDGMNEKGVSIAVLTLDSEPTRQTSSSRPGISTSLAIRLVLDRADSTAKAVELLKGYGMIATGGRDYHFYITDSKGDGRVVEYDCDSEDRRLVDTKCEAVTNFYAMHQDKVAPGRRNGIYGHGKERYDAAMGIIEDTRDSACNEDAWIALRATSQTPNPDDITSNTQWSLVYDDTELSGEVSIRLHWEDRFGFELGTTDVVRKPTVRSSRCGRSCHEIIGAPCLPHTSGTHRDSEHGRLSRDGGFRDRQSHHLQRQGDGTLRSSIRGSMVERCRFDGIAYDGGPIGLRR